MTSHLMQNLTFTVSVVLVVQVVLVVHYYLLNHVNAVYFVISNTWWKNQLMKLNCQIMKCCKPVVVKNSKTRLPSNWNITIWKCIVAYWKIYSPQIRIKKILLRRCWCCFKASKNWFFHLIHQWISVVVTAMIAVIAVKTHVQLNVVVSVKAMAPHNQWIYIVSK